MAVKTGINDFLKFLTIKKNQAVWPEVTLCPGKIEQDQPGMMLLIRLMVKYDCSTDALMPYILKSDKRKWMSFFAGFKLEVFICHQEGHIFLLIRDCADQKRMEQAFTKLPLIREGFFEIKVYQFIGFDNLDSFFGPA